ncbi:MAG TPA: DUF6295 family protein [Acidimicrobiales bacterium]|nr:DUF6295 family protein [Acidimicrobiales bacterium]
MCTYVTTSTEVAGSGYAGDDWFAVDRAVVYFDHPQDAPLDHALCIDVWAGKDSAAVGKAGTGRIAVELDAASARRLAEAILATLDHDEVKPLL